MAEIINLSNYESQRKLISLQHRLQPRSPEPLVYLALERVHRLNKIFDRSMGNIVATIRKRQNLKLKRLAATSCLPTATLVWISLPLANPDPIAQTLCCGLFTLGGIATAVCQQRIRQQDEWLPVLTSNYYNATHGREICTRLLARKIADSRVPRGLRHLTRWAGDLLDHMVYRTPVRSARPVRALEREQALRAHGYSKAGQPNLK